jgi:hypothetical protein
MNARERFLSVMNFEPVQTVRWEFGYWAGAVRRWYAEGLPKKDGLADKWGEGEGIHGGAAGWRPGRPLGSDINTLFGLDESLQRTLFNNYLSPPFEEIVLEDHERWVLVRNEMGMLEKRLKERGSLSAYLDGPVKTREDWETLKAERLKPTLEGRLPENWQEIKNVYQQRTFPLAIGGGQGFFGTSRFLLGETQVLTASYHCPDLLKQIVNDLADFWIALYDQVLDQVDVDLAMLWEDICYNNGPLIAPKTFREFILPGYLKFTAFLRERGVKHVLVDTDGDIWKLLPLFLEGGVTGIYPFEVAAGMDVMEVRKAYPRLQILGGIAKSALIAGQVKIDEELDTKIPWMLKQGGYIPYMDHLVPPDVSWQNFSYYRKKLNDLIEAAHPA